MEIIYKVLGEMIRTFFLVSVIFIAFSIIVTAALFLAFR